MPTKNTLYINCWSLSPDHLSVDVMKAGSPAAICSRAKIGSELNPPHCLVTAPAQLQQAKLRQSSELGLGLLGLPAGSTEPGAGEGGSRAPPKTPESREPCPCCALPGTAQPGCLQCCRDTAGTVHGHCMDTAGTMHGHCMDAAWILHGQKHYRDTAWTLQGHCRDSAWTVQGHCTDTARTLQGHCMDRSIAGPPTLQVQPHCRAAAANPAGLVPMASVEALCALTSVSSRENLSNLSLNAKIMKYQQAG